MNRELFPQIVAALKPNGILFYETWSQQRVDDAGPSNSAFRLEAGELLKLSQPLGILFYREEGMQGDTSKGNRNTAMLVA